MRTENWCGYDIRFIEKDGEWWAILKDICDALKLHTFKISQRLDPDMLCRIPVETSDIPLKYNRSRGENKTRYMLAVNEMGIYEALFASRRLKARKFRRWSAGVMKKLRSSVGLQGYEVMRMTETEIQDEIDHILDTLFWDEEKKCVMQSVTVQGGDVEQVPFGV
jgi:prophage antirepressor-like protein